MRSAALVCGLAACIALNATAPAGAAEITRTDLAIPGLPDTVGFLYKGPVASGDLLNLQSQISALPPDTAVAVVLELLGGSLSEGIALGRFFHKAKIIAVVGAGGVAPAHARSRSSAGATPRPASPCASRARPDGWDFTSSA